MDYHPATLLKIPLNALLPPRLSCDGFISDYFGFGDPFLLTSPLSIGSAQFGHCDNERPIKYKM